MTEFKPIFFNAADFKRLSKTSRDSLRECGYIPVSVPNPESVNTIPDISITGNDIARELAKGISRQTDMTRGDIMKDIIKFLAKDE